MNTQKITSLLSIGQLAVDMHCAERWVQLCKDAYHDKIREVDDTPKEDRDKGWLSPYSEECAETIELTKGEYAAVKAAKRKVYNIKRRINTAIRNSGLGSADAVHAVLDAERGEI